MKGDSSANFGIKVMADPCHGSMRGNVHMRCPVVHLISQLDETILVTTSHFLSNLPSRETTDVPGIAVIDHRFKLGWTRMP